ncbi:kinase-like domain-containing protein [Spinellus fusiger]|nr:kinase-like domain-containing protein [Spinellus fusiger]
MNDGEIDTLYHRQINDQIILQTRQIINQLLELYSHEFGLENLASVKPHLSSRVTEKLTQLYQEVCNSYLNISIPFDHEWHWSLIWRQQLSFKALSTTYGQDQVLKAIHPRAYRALSQIYLVGLDQYMQWFPWNWFSNMQFIGAGGFSAVYAVCLRLPYEPQPIKMALKVVDDKILNEIRVQSKAFLPLLFQGLTVCESTGDLMMVMKFSNDGNLEDHMQQTPLEDLDLKIITSTILRLVADLADLHKLGMCHRNVHPRNIVCTDSDYFLVDYRFSTLTSESSSVTTLTQAVYGQLPYVAPEVRKGIYTEKSDIYSLGVIIWQLVSKVIFPSPDILLYGSQKEDVNEMDEKMFLEHVYRIEHVPGLPEWYRQLYVACLEPDPDNRPDANALCQALHPIHEQLGFSVPLSQRVSEYIVARRAEVIDHIRAYTKSKGDIVTSGTRLYTLSTLPYTENLIMLPFTHRPLSTLSI